MMWQQCVALFRKESSSAFDDLGIIDVLVSVLSFAHETLWLFKQTARKSCV